MQYKDFYQAKLLKAGAISEGVVRATDEQVTPLATNFIIEKWLCTIDPWLLGHIVQTKGSMFTVEKPTLACNLQLLTDQIPMMLAELDTAENISLNRLQKRRQLSNPCYIQWRSD